MNKVIKGIIALTATAVLAACSSGAGPTSAPAPGESPAGGGDATGQKIGVVIPSGDHGFTGESVAHAKMEADALMAANDGLEIIVKDGADAAAQITSIENMLAGGDIDLIMLWPMEGEALRSAAQSIVDAGVKLVIYDRLITDFEGLNAQIMGDNEAIGKGMGEYVTNYYADDDTVNYLRFVGDSSTVTAQRSGGMDAVIDAGKFVQVANTFVTDWSTETAQGQLEEWLNARSQADIEALDLIVTHDDEVTDGVMNALESYSGPATLNVKLVTSVGGREGTLQRFEATKTGVLFTTFFFAPSFIRESLRLSLAELNGTPFTGASEVDGVYLIPSFSIGNAGNADMTFDEYRASDIYKERYSIGIE